MKPITPHDPLDDLIAAALHGELTPEERTHFESRLTSDPAAQAAYQEAQAMHDLLEKTNRSAQPDPDFEQRMISGVRRKLAHPPHEETAWESLMILWKGLCQAKSFVTRIRVAEAVVILGMIAVLAGVALGPITSGIKKAKSSAELQAGHAMLMAEYQAQLDAGVANPSVPTSVQATPEGRILAYANDHTVDITDKVKAFEKTGVLPAEQKADNSAPAPAQTLNATAKGAANFELFAGKTVATAGEVATAAAPTTSAPEASSDLPNAAPVATTAPPLLRNAPNSALASDTSEAKFAEADKDIVTKASPLSPTRHRGNIYGVAVDSTGQIVSGSTQAPTLKQAETAAAPASTDTRKLIRNAQLDLEVKSYQAAFDQITALTKSAGGYVDTSSSQRGGNGKLQGTVVVKILPENLDAFLLKLRDLGEVQNQSVSTDDVTKDYYDTQARLVNAQKMEEQLQDLLKRENGKVADLLAVERELGRVRGQIEEMQGQLKLYDFQVQYATVTMNLAEKDLNQAAAYLLREQDAFSLYATDVEGAFQKARATADKYNAQVLAANLEHDVNSDNNQIAASLVVMVAPEQIEPFLAEIRGLGRVANFTRQTERVAKDGGDSSQPADETKTEKDKVRVQLSISSDNDSRKQVALTVITKDVDGALDAAKAAALANAGTEILGSSLNTTPQGASTGQLTVRVPGKAYATLLEAFRALGRPAALSVQRNDNNGPGASGDDVPVILSLALSDNDTPVQTTNLAITADDVDAQAQQIKKQAGDNGVEIKSSSFQRQPDGTEQAQITLRLPIGKYPSFLATLEKAGKVDSLSVQRDDRPDQASTDDAAPAEIQLQLNNPPALVPDNGGLWATLRDTFGQGFAALFDSIRVIGVMIAFLAPWLVTLIFCAWVGRRIYLWRKNR